MKPRPALPSVRHVRKLLAACLLLAGWAAAAQAQTSIYDASFDAGGNNVTATGVALNPFTVTGVFKYNAQVTVYIADGSGANGRIFSTSAFSTLPTVGAQYTATVNTTVFQGTEEFTNPANFAPTGLLSAVTPTRVTVDQIAITAPFGGSPSSGLYNAALTFAPVTFTITPDASGTLSTTGSTYLTDTASGLQVQLYRSAAATDYTAGTAYTVSGYEQPFNNASEIVGVFNMTAAAVPEPGTWALLAAGGLIVGAAGLRRRAAGQTA